MDVLCRFIFAACFLKYQIGDHGIGSPLLPNNCRLKNISIIRFHQDFWNALSLRWNIPLIREKSSVEKKSNFLSFNSQFLRNAATRGRSWGPIYVWRRLLFILKYRKRNLNGTNWIPTFNWGELSKENVYKKLQEANHIDKIVMRQYLHVYPPPPPFPQWIIFFLNI